MVKYEYTLDYGKNKKGDTIEHDMGIYHKVIHPLLMKGILKKIGKVDIEKKLEPEDDTKKMLMGMKMGVLRKFGKDYDARDTDKEELVDEIIDKAPLNDIKKFLEVS